MIAFFFFESMAEKTYAPDIRPFSICVIQPDIKFSIRPDFRPIGYLKPDIGTRLLPDTNLAPVLDIRLSDIRLI